jgi:hypothetical protein
MKLTPASRHSIRKQLSTLIVAAARRCNTMRSAGIEPTQDFLDLRARAVAAKRRLAPETETSLEAWKEAQHCINALDATIKQTRRKWGEAAHR